MNAVISKLTEEIRAVSDIHIQQFRGFYNYLPEAGILLSEPELSQWIILLDSRTDQAVSRILAQSGVDLNSCTDLQLLGVIYKECVNATERFIHLSNIKVFPTKRYLM